MSDSIVDQQAPILEGDVLADWVLHDVRYRDDGVGLLLCKTEAGIKFTLFAAEAVARELVQSRLQLRRRDRRRLERALNQGRNVRLGWPNEGGERDGG